MRLVTALLVAVTVECFCDFFLIASSLNCRSTQVSPTLIGDSSSQVTCTSTTVLGFALGCQTESFLGSLVGFLFRHLLEPCTNANLDHGLYEVLVYHGRGATRIKS